MRSYASKGAADIVAVPPAEYSHTLLIQAKHSKRCRLSISPAEVRVLRELQFKSNALVIIIYNGPDGALMVRPLVWEGVGPEITLEEFLVGIRTGYTSQSNLRTQARTS